MLAILLLGPAFSSIGAADCPPEDCRLILRAYALGVDSRSSVVEDAAADPGVAAGASRLSLGAGGGWGLEVEYRFGRRWGLSGGAFFVDFDLGLALERGGRRGEDREGIGISVLVVGPTFHLAPGRRADLYLSPRLAFVDFGTGLGDLVNDEDPAHFMIFGETHERDLSDAFAPGLEVGLDLPFAAGGRWGLHLAATYLDLATDAGGPELQVDPLDLSVGFWYRP
ncbi:MAG: hypothetical protein D6696_05840 [Acidobacteria bacterium]|nr:MAG: hypothetical protein D6696_05840 [Acidobacteriota bacterium]